MESLDLIAREFGLVPGDRRGVVVRLTETGHRDVLVIARVLDDLVDGLLRDLGRVIEQRERQGVPATPTAPTNAQGPGATTIERPQGSDPAAELRDRSRENMDVFLRIATAGETIKQASVGVFEELEFALNVPQMALYGLLVHGSLRPTEIAALTGLTSGGVSGLLDRLEAVGLITRDFGLVPGDRRAVTVRLTEKASKGMLVVVEMRTEPVERLLDDLTPLIEARAQRAAGAKPAI
jgi:DNA-binding MarR family transcriptional regulator